MEKADILILGTGVFAARILFDLVTVAHEPTTIVIAGRNAERLAWLGTAAKARSAIFGTPITIVTRQADLLADDAGAQIIGQSQPTVIVQAASPQSSSVIAATGNRWAAMVARAGLSLTTVFQAYLSSKLATATAKASPGSCFINCCYPDVSNGILHALGLPVTCGVGNVAILAAVFATSPAAANAHALDVLAHYQTLTPWRQPPQERHGPAPRVWRDGNEVSDVFATFRDIRLTREPVIDVSGATGVPMMLAMAHGKPWHGHVPGPNGLPGGYPVAWRDGALSVVPPAGLSIADTIAWNAAFEQRNGVYVDDNGYVHYTGEVRDCLAEESPELAKGFAVTELFDVHAQMISLRDRLETRQD